MRAFLIAPYYIHWHYGRALNGIIEITQNLAWFLWHFFSVGVLMQTLFSPWQRLQEQHKRGLDIGNYLSSLTINIVMRCVGALVRSIFIILGLISICFTYVGGVIVFIVWLAFPLAVVFGIILGFVFMFRAS